MIQGLKLTKPTINTGRYDVSDEEFGVKLKSGVYLVTKALLEAFGDMPRRIRITVEEEM